MFGAPSVKPTRLLASHAALEVLRCRCQGGHQHVRLKGKVWSAFFRAWVFRTKLALIQMTCADSLLKRFALYGHPSVCNLRRVSLYVPALGNGRSVNLCGGRNIAKH